MTAFKSKFSDSSIKGHIQYTLLPFFVAANILSMSLSFPLKGKHDV